MTPDNTRPTMGAACAYQRSIVVFTPRMVKSRSKMLMPSGELLKMYVKNCSNSRTISCRPPLPAGAAVRVWIQLFRNKDR